MKISYVIVSFLLISTVFVNEAQVQQGPAMYSKGPAMVRCDLRFTPKKLYKFAELITTNTLYAYIKQIELSNQQLQTSIVLVLKNVRKPLKAKDRVQVMKVIPLEIEEFTVHCILKQNCYAQAWKKLYENIEQKIDAVFQENEYSVSQGEKITLSENLGKALKDFYTVEEKHCPAL